VNEPETELVDRLRLLADLWLHRHGPWWLVLAGVVGRCWAWS
jgi:hypothetical protein